MKSLYRREAKRLVCGPLIHIVSIALVKDVYFSLQEGEFIEVFLLPYANLYSKLQVRVALWTRHATLSDASVALHDKYVNAE